MIALHVKLVLLYFCLKHLKVSIAVEAKYKRSVGAFKDLLDRGNRNWSDKCPKNIIVLSLNEHHAIMILGKFVTTFIIQELPAFRVQALKVISINCCFKYFLRLSDLDIWSKVLPKRAILLETNNARFKYEVGQVFNSVAIPFFFIPIKNSFSMKVWFIIVEFAKPSHRKTRTPLQSNLMFSTARLTFTEYVFNLLKLVGYLLFCILPISYLFATDLALTSLKRHFKATFEKIIQLNL